jgi:hypothetical protein
VSIFPQHLDVLNARCMEQRENPLEVVLDSFSNGLNAGGFSGG